MTLLRIPAGAWRASLLLSAAVASVAAARCSGTDVTIQSGQDGTEAFVSGPAAPPVSIDREGVHEPPTPTPGPITPVYPVATAVPTKTPRPR